MKLGDDILINKVIRDCPICNNTHELQYRKRISNAIVKGEKIETEEFYFLCTVTEDEENEFVSAKMMDENLLRAKDAYRKKAFKKGLIYKNKQYAENTVFEKGSAKI